MTATSKGLNFEAILASLASLDGFAAVVQARREAAASRAEGPALTGYMVLGRYLLTERGDFGIATDDSLAPAMSPVVDVSDFAKVVRSSSVSFKMDSAGPVSAAVRGKVCGRGWSVATIADLHQERPHRER